MKSTFLRINIDTFDGNIHYIKNEFKNDNEFVLIFPGLGDSCFMFENMLSYLPSEDYNIVVVDYPGFGFSSKPDHKLSTKLMVDVLISFVEVLKMDNVHILANSLGGALAIVIAYLKQEIIRSITLISPIGMGKDVYFPIKLISVKPLGNIFLKLLMNRYLANSKIVQNYYFHLIAPELDMKQITPKMRQIYPINYGGGSNRNSYLFLLQNYLSLSGQSEELLNLIKQLSIKISGNIPILLIWGKNDKILPISQLESAVNVLKPEKTLVLESGHLPFIDQPKLIADELRNFVVKYTV